MKFSFRARLALLLVGGGTLSFAATSLMPAVVAQSRRLEIWPAQRVLLSLPLQVGANFSSDASLSRAIVPLVEPELRRALESTDKFSTMATYRFDPVLRRAVLENRVADAEVTTLVQTPTLENAQTVLGKLSFSQPAMILETTLEELRVGGTPRNPTVQLQVSGRLHEVGGGLFRSATVTSRPYGGRTPEARLAAAARDAFNELAEQFVAPPESFALPAPPAPTPAPRRPAPTPRPAPATQPVPPAFSDSSATVQPPGVLAPTQGVPFVPVLPPAQPPLGLNVPESATR